MEINQVVNLEGGENGQHALMLLPQGRKYGVLALDCREM